MTSPFKTLIIDLSSTYGLIAVSGKDAQKFLQGQLTSDVRQITTTSHGLTAYCNLKGRIRALFRIFFHKECYYLQCPISILSNTLNILQKYARFSKVELQNVSEQWRSIGISIQPVNSHTPREALFPYITAQNILREFLCTPNKKEILSVGQLQIQENFLVLSLPDLYARFEILGLSHSIEALRKKLSDYIIETANNLRNFNHFEAWKLFDIKAGIPEIWPETVEKFLPHSLNLPALGAVSFTKGCYCGQEVIARMEHRANLKKYMYRATTEKIFQTPLPGTTLKTHQAANEEVGTVIMASQSGPRIEMLIEAQNTYVSTPNSLFIFLEDQTIPLIIEQTFSPNTK